MKTTKRIIVSFSIPEEKSHILKRFDKLVALERPRGRRSELLLRAIEEYVDRHWPGNPQLTLVSSSLGDPRRDKAAINFLRHRVGLPLRQIAEIVGRSIGYVQGACVKGGPRGRKVTPQSIIIYKDRFKKWMRGEYKTLGEAFLLW